MSDSHKKIGKFISLLLRHRPELGQLELDPNGWVATEELIAACERHGFQLDIDGLRIIVATNDKQRYMLNDDATKIRANQGHSIKNIDLELQPIQPPALLYHGTTQERAAQILASALRPQSRQHVHLSADINTATNVGSRHGKPYILTVSAAEAHAEGYKFYCSANGVWLADLVPAKFISAP